MTLGHDGLRFEAKKLHDVLGQRVVNLRMPRYWLFPPSSRIDIDVVTTTMTMQHAASLLQLANELAAFHKAISLV